MKVPPWVPLALGGLVVALVYLVSTTDKRAERKLGQWQAIAKRLQDDSARAAGAVARADTQFIRDTVVYTRSRNVYRDRVDSIRVHDTLTVTERVIVAAADTVIRACADALNSCAATRAARDSLIAVLGQQRDADRKRFAAELRTRSPRLLPFVEAGVDPLHQWAITGRAGAQIRIAGPLSLSGALNYSQAPQTTTRALLGVRVTF